MSELLTRLKDGCVYVPKRWCGDRGESSRVDEGATDALLLEAAHKITKMCGLLTEAAQALELHDCSLCECGDCPDSDATMYGKLIIELRKEAQG